MDDSAYDCVVIGAGLGGLTAGALLAKAGRKVCVIERNHAVGGAASAFKKGALTIEPALHQTADPRLPGDPKHAILSRLGLLDEIEWLPVRPFFSVRGGPVGESFDLPVGFAEAREAMAQRFPKSRSGIERMFAAIESFEAGVTHLSQSRDERSIPKLLRAGVELRGLARDWRVSLDAALRRYLADDEGAKFAVAGNLAYYADDPARMSWPFFAIAQGGFFKSGGVFIKGGSRVLSMKLARVILRAGGAVTLGREAVGVDLDGEGKPAFVRHVDPKTRAEERVATRQVLANCAPQILAPMLPAPAREKMQASYAGRALSTSLFSAHFGLSVAPQSLGLAAYGAAVVPDWMTAFADTAASAGLLSADPGERLPLYGVANYAAIDPSLAGDGPSLVTVVGVDHFANWAALAPQAEKDRRERWLDAFQAELDRAYPGFAAAVTERMFLNARSMRGFLNTPDGAVYGFAPAPPERGLWAGMPRSPRTPVPGLYLASSFTMSGGFSGAMESGEEAARLALAAA